MCVGLLDFWLDDNAALAVVALVSVAVLLVFEGVGTLLRPVADAGVLGGQGEAEGALVLQLRQSLW